MDRQDMIDLIVGTAKAHGLEPWEFLGGAFAESGHNLDQWERWGTWPDVSFGLFHQTVAFADEGDHTESAENVAYIRDLYFDPAHASTVAARKFKHYRTREASALDAWCRYNWPAREPARNPNRGNYAAGLEAAQRILGAPAMPVTYNKAEPDIRQNDPWSCSCTSARWSLKALGRNPSEQWIEETMLAEGVVTREHGLMDATGAGLADFLRRHYGEFGYDANHEPAITWDWAVHEGGNPDGSGHQYPVMIGGRGWNHWATLKDFDPTSGRLALMNPAPNWMGTGTTLDEATFNALGPFSAVRLWHPDLFAAPAPPAPPPPAPEPPPSLPKLRTLAEVRAALRELEERIEL